MALTSSEMMKGLAGGLRRVHEATAAELAQVLADVAAELTGARLAILLLADERDQARVVASSGAGLPEDPERPFEAPLDPQLPEQLRQHFGMASEERVLAAPVMAETSVRGLLVVREPEYVEADLVLLGLADHAALALARTARERRLSQAEHAASRAIQDQRLFRSLLAGLPAALWMADPDGRIRAASSRAVELSGEGAPRFRPMEPGVEGETPLVRALRSGELVREQAWCLVRDGRELPLLCSAGPVFAEDGSRAGAVLLGQDLRARQAHEAEERERLAQLEAGKTKDVFFNALSHELRTPLAAILFALEVLQHPDASATQRERAHRTIERNVRHQVRLIDDLLDVSRIMRRRAQIEARPLDLGKLVASAVAELEESAHRVGLELRVCLPGAPLMVKGDRGRLEQVVKILVENGIKFTEPGGAVEIALTAEERWAVLSVRDTGTGITAEMLPRLFEPLQQGERSLSRSRGGLGTGLAIARWVVEQHGGQTGASSAGLGEGSEFTVRLPLLESAGQEAEPPGAAAHPASSLDRYSVLVVEDNHDLLDTLLSLLEMLGHRVLPASNGLNALEAAEREHPEVALIDIGLPDMDGYELARRLRAQRQLRGMRLVALTGYASEGHRQRALRAGFDDYLAKPVDMETIRIALAGKQQADGKPA